MQKFILTVEIVAISYSKSYELPKQMQFKYVYIAGIFIPRCMYAGIQNIFRLRFPSWW